MISAKNIGNGVIDLVDFRPIGINQFEQERRRAGPIEGDVLLTIVGTVGRTAVVTPGLRQFALQRSVALIRPVGIQSKFLMYQLQSEGVQKWLQGRARGTAQQGVYLKTLRELPVWVFNDEKQSAIVDEIETQFSRLEAGIAALKRAQANLKRYRASVLHTAFTIGFGYLGLAQESCKLSGVCDVIDPQPSHRTPPESIDGVSYIGIGDASKRGGGFDFAMARKVSHDVLIEHRTRYSLIPGDFIIGKIGTVGAVIELPEPFDYTLSANVVLIQPNRTKANSRFLKYFILSPLTQQLFSVGSRATTQSAFGIKRFRDLEIPLPPLAEQERIVAEVERRLSVVDQLEATIAAQLTRTARLRQSILHRAFTPPLQPKC